MSTERGTGTNGRRRNGAMPGTPAGSNESEASSPLEQHVRRETQEFTFGALMGEPSLNRADDSAPSRPEDRFPSVLPERPRPSETDTPRMRTPSRQSSSSAFRPVVPGPAHAAASPAAAPSRSGRRSGVSLPLVIGITLAVALPTGFLVANSVTGKRAANSGGTAISAPPAAASTAPEVAGQRKPGQPDPALTPGQRLPNARTAGPISEAVRQKVLQAYGVQPVGSGGIKPVVIRLIPASLGGTEDPANLFPTTPWFAELKGRLDRYLADQVLRGAMTMEQAEKDLKTDWIEATHRYNIRNYGKNDPKAAAETQARLKW